MRTATEGKINEVTYWWPRPGSDKPLEKRTFFTKGGWSRLRGRLLQVVRGATCLAEHHGSVIGPADRRVAGRTAPPRPQTSKRPAAWSLAGRRGAAACLNSRWERVRVGSAASVPVVVNSVSSRPKCRCCTPLTMYCQRYALSEQCLDARRCSSSVNVAIA